jgi:hypothetical protein
MGDTWAENLIAQDSEYGLVSNQTIMRIINDCLPGKGVHAYAKR